MDDDEEDDVGIGEHVDSDVEDDCDEGDSQEEEDVEDDEDEDGLETADSIHNMVPIEFAKAHIAKIEDDMKHMHERHVKLMREMDSNYKMIEKETQEYYVEFLQKWREVAKSKITQYRRQSEQLLHDKEMLVKEKLGVESELEEARQQCDQLMRDKRQLMLKHNDDLQARETEIESMRIANEQKEKEKLTLKARADEARNEASLLQKQCQNKQIEFDQELERVKNELENEVKELENALSEKREELDKVRIEKGKLLTRCEKLEAKVLLHSQQSNNGATDGSKPTVQIRNSSLVDKLKASNIIAQAATSGANAAAGSQQKRLLVIKNKVVRSDSGSKQTI